MRVYLLWNGNHLGSRLCGYTDLYGAAELSPLSLPILVIHLELIDDHHSVAPFSIQSVENRLEMVKLTQSCQICYSVLPKKRNFADLPCACVICTECFRVWVLEQCHSLASPDFTIHCPTPMHHTTLPPSTLKKLLPKRDYHLYETTAFQRILHRNEYLKCNRCHLISWTKWGICGACPYCGFPVNHAISTAVQSLVNLHDAVGSVILKEIVSFPCPSCGSYISRSSGCDHMTCVYCGFEFCWQCHQSYDEHNETKCVVNCAVITSWLMILLGLVVVRFGQVYWKDLNGILPYLGLILIVVWVPYYFCIVLPDLVRLLSETTSLYHYISIAAFTLFGVISGAIDLWLIFPLFLQLLFVVNVTAIMSFPGIGLFLLWFED